MIVWLFVWWFVCLWEYRSINGPNVRQKNSVGLKVYTRFLLINEETIKVCVFVTVRGNVFSVSLIWLCIVWRDLKNNYFFSFGVRSARIIVSWTPYSPSHWLNA